MTVRLKIAKLPVSLSTRKSASRTVPFGEVRLILIHMENIFEVKPCFQNGQGEKI